MPQIVVRIPDDLAEWLESRCPNRGEASKLVRQLLTAEQMKEAVAPLVPDDSEFCQVACSQGQGCADPLNCRQPLPETPEETEVLDRMHGITEGSVGNPSISLRDALQASVEATKSKTVKDSPIARRGVSATSGDLAGSGGAESPSLIVKDSPVASAGSVNEKGTMKVVSPESPSALPARCNRGACTGVLHQLSGRCLRCNQLPLKRRIPKGSE